MKAKILGVDLSLTGTGVVFLKGDEVIFQKLIKSKPLGDLPIHEIERLVGIIGKIDIDSVDLVVIEGIAFGIRKTTSLSQLSGLNYLLREKCYNSQTPFVIVAPNTLKKFITGKGVGQKDMLMLAVYKKWGFNPSDNNVNDAYALAKIGEALLDKKEEGLLAYEKEVINLLKKQI